MNSSNKDQISLPSKEAKSGTKAYINKHRKKAKEKKEERTITGRGGSRGLGLNGRQGDRNDESHSGHQTQENLPSRRHRSPRSLSPTMQHKRKRLAVPPAHVHEEHSRREEANGERNPNKPGDDSLRAPPSDGERIVVRPGGVLVGRFFCELFE
ncbi:hypothetical protein GW17_00002969 [Ensete ventricosum]|nr:hypothetical protein GW17_00002969 [Ensete ventricosum]